MVSVQCSVGRENELALSRALLLYTHGSESLVTVHDVENINGRMLVRAGQALDKNILTEVIKCLQSGQRLSGGYIHDHVLAMSEQSIAWFRPSSPASMFFRLTDKQDELNSLTGKSVIQPSLVFTFDGIRIRVFAMKGNRRPTPDTRLYHTPYYNVDGNGYVCMPFGVKKPVISQHVTGEVEKLFFESAFSHSGRRYERIIRGEETHNQFWHRLIMEQPKRFPVGKLIVSKMTLEEIL